MISDKFVIIGTIINLIGTSTYVFDTIKGKTRPNRVSWFMWSLAPLVAFAAELSKGVGLQALMTFTAGFSPLLVLVASFVNRKSVWKLTKFDLLCGALSLLGLLLWLATREGNIAIFFSIVADALAAIPTLTKSYKDPASENWIAFAGGGANALIALLTIDHWNFATYGFPAYILGICIVFVLLIRFKLGLKIRPISEHLS